MLKISAFYLDKQKSFVPNATKLCNFCDMMFDVRPVCSGTHHCVPEAVLRRVLITESNSLKE